MYRIGWILIGLVVLVAGCAVPESARERWGWKRSAETASRTLPDPFEQSLREGFPTDVRNSWRVLNYTLRYLATEKRKSERADSRTDGYLRDLASHDITSDSSAVMQLWERIFYSEDKNWGGMIDSTATPNSFISDVIVHRLPYVARYGFDPFTGLTAFGQEIAKTGVKSVDSWGMAYVELTLRNGLSYRAEETRDFVYEVKLVVEGPADRDAPREGLAYVPVGASDNPLANSSADPNQMAMTEKRKRMESASLRVEHQHELLVPSPDRPFEIRHAKVVAFPWPSPEIEEMDSSFFAQEWSGNRILVDLAANIEDLVRVQSGEGSVVEVEAEWAVYRSAGSARERALVDAGNRAYRQEVSGSDEGAGIMVRLLTGFLPDSGRYDIELRISNGGRVHLEKEGDIALSGRKRPREMPLLVVDSVGPSSSSPIPRLRYGGAVGRDERVAICMPVDGLYARADGDERFGGVAQVLLTRLPTGTAHVLTDSTLEVLGFGEGSYDSGSSAFRPTTYESAMAPYEAYRIGLIPLVSGQPRLLLRSQVVLPEGIDRGRYLLSVAVFSQDGATGFVERVAEGFSVIRLD